MTKPNANLDKLRMRVLLAKVRLRAEELRIELRTTEAELSHALAQERATVSRLRHEVAEAKAKAEQTDAWKRSADAYCAQANILRQQLVDAGIESDPRAS